MRRREGLARSKTAWTRWTFPRAIAGCLTWRYRRFPSVLSVLDWPERCRLRAVDGDMAVQLRWACSALAPGGASGGVDGWPDRIRPEDFGRGVCQVRQSDEAPRPDDELYRLKHVLTWAVTRSVRPGGETG